MTLADFSFNALILSAGRASRMGMNKALLPFNGEYNFLQHLLSVYAPFAKRVVVVLPERAEACDVRDYPNTVLVENKYPERGRNYSIHLGLRQIDNDFPVFIQNIDNPFTDGQLLERLLKKRENYDYCYVAHGKKGGHPLLISAAVKEKFLSYEPADIHFRRFLESFSHTVLPVENAKYTYNINTREDYVQIFGQSPEKTENETFS